MSNEPQNMDDAWENGTGCCLYAPLELLVHLFRAIFGGGS
jgi:hypothetical protein